MPTQASWTSTSDDDVAVVPAWRYVPNNGGLHIPHAALAGSWLRSAVIEATSLSSSMPAVVVAYLRFTPEIGERAGEAMGLRLKCR